MASSTLHKDPLRVRIEREAAEKELEREEIRRLHHFGDRPGDSRLNEELSQMLGVAPQQAQTATRPVPKITIVEPTADANLAVRTVNLAPQPRLTVEEKAIVTAVATDLIRRTARGDTTAMQTQVLTLPQGTKTTTLETARSRKRRKPWWVLIVLALAAATVTGRSTSTEPVAKPAPKVSAPAKPQGKAAPSTNKAPTPDSNVAPHRASSPQGNTAPQTSTTVPSAPVTPVSPGTTVVTPSGGGGTTTPTNTKPTNNPTSTGDTNGPGKVSNGKQPDQNQGGGNCSDPNAHANGDGTCSTGNGTSAGSA